ncbi:MULTISPECIES: AAA family ATPase [unclassified Corallococcus]|uniref:AAA family ATPase n=1 Tax=unclassified Corallococcus TaxID=2685029 RepID=UPI001CBAD3B5|nr:MULTISPECIES: AAA family ATPase [unclassified Corallococcus]MBZ4329331.1 ATP-binding protein [Corallococcus sp. AS-1-12]MBZ4373178.1 ATP-binding protein [Corallococcus sp. AS-1-6]
MRIAMSGTHRVGKSTLIEDLGERLSGYRLVDEPYHLLEEEGYEFASPPSLEDFVAQLRRSLELLEEEDTRNVLFDRCPLDFLGYLLTHEDSDAFDAEEWLARIRSTLQTLDFVVFVPIEERDRIRVPAHEDSQLRRAVDEKLAWILLDDPFELGVEVLSVHGSGAARVSQVLERLGSMAGR